MSEEKNSSNLTKSPKNSILKKKSSSNINYDTELSINDDLYKQKKPSCISANQSDGSSGSKRSIFSNIGNIFQKKSQSHIHSMTMDNENHVSYDKGEKFATHVAISPNGRLQFKIF
ncbi:hypothetical protein RclHR1_34150002 [Rhizophagus clarus]|uniref:Uncharacterized protein n=1 Tax=Rhizophagus clarus TaxID=94130 RepID=A0A2Z6RAG9_9GLOM|nr:hypothetical protein RclHR1_34150002 [Rhizophagus clarus]